MQHIIVITVKITFKLPLAHTPPHPFDVAIIIFTMYMATVNQVVLVVLNMLLGSSGGVVNSLDFCPASLKSLGCFYFWCMLSSQWKMVTVNL